MLIAATLTADQLTPAIEHIIIFPVTLGRDQFQMLIVCVFLYTGCLLALFDSLWLNYGFADTFRYEWCPIS